MCLELKEVKIKMESWGDWHWHNAGYGANLGFTSDGKCAKEHLITGACGGGNKIEVFNEMPVDVAETDQQLMRLGSEQIELCRWLFIVNADHSEKLRFDDAKYRFKKKYKKSDNYFKTKREALWSKLSALLDKPRIDHYQYYCEKNGLQAPS